LLIATLFLFKPRNLRLLPMLPKLGIATTVDASLRRRFRSPKLVQLFDRFATYNGGSAHPGGGIPLALLSERITAGLVARDLASQG
jgi:hypothetical protein